MKTDNQSIDKNESFLTFTLNGENFAVPIKNVMEIMESGKITQVPNAPKTIVGIFNFRGEIVPLVDMYNRFNCTEGSNSAKMIIVVDLEVEKKKTHIGLYVDDVTDVIEFSAADIRKTPEMGIHYSQDFLQGIVDIDKQFVMVLNIEKVLDFKIETSDYTA
jgi:purine-binding chemotaxis protein CheW